MSFSKRAAGLTAAAVLAPALVLAAPHLAIADQPAQVGPGSAAGDPCRDPAGGPCTIKVPLDYAKPEGEQIGIRIWQLPASGPAAQRRGILLVNPGGPGESGIELADLLKGRLPEQVLDRYDLVGFDPRGVGQSAPVTCGDTKRLGRHPLPDYVPARPADTKPHIDRARAIARQCGEKAKAMLPYTTTANAARDMDRIRVALGEQKISYLGYSYGTTLGATYATLYPGRVDRMILDSVTDPTKGDYDSSFDQDAAFQHRLDDFFAWIARNDPAYHLGTNADDVTAKWASLRKQLKTKPAGKVIGPSELEDLAAGAMYVDVQWPDLADAFAQYVKGKPAPLAAIGTDLIEESPVSPGMLAYVCADSVWPRDFATWEADTRRAYRTAPFIAWLNTWAGLPCASWTVPGRPGIKIDGKAVPPVLMLQAARDPATPLTGAQRMHAAFPASRLVVEGGGNHGQYRFNENACIDRIGTAFLLSGTLPVADTTCPAGPDPTPDASADSDVIRLLAH